MDKGPWWAPDHGVAELDTTEQLTHTENHWTAREVPYWCFFAGDFHPFHSPSTRRKFPTTVYSSYVASPFPGAWVASSQLCLGCFAFLLFHEPSLITHGMAHVWTTYLGIQRKTKEKEKWERVIRIKKRWKLAGNDGRRKRNGNHIFY